MGIQVKVYLGRAAAVALALLGFGLQGPAAAQTATNLICNGCVGAGDLGANTVRSGHIKNGDVKPADLSNAAKPAAVAASESLGTDDVEFFEDTVVQKARINIPGPGAVIAHYNVVAFNSGAGQRVACAATTGKTTAGQMLTEGVVPVGVNGRLTLSGTKTFKVSKAMKLKVNLVCRTFTSYPIKANFPTLALVFVPGAQKIVTGPAGAAIGE